MIVPFLYLFNVILLTRLPLYLRDASVKGASSLVACLFQLLALLPLTPGVASGILAVGFVGLSLIGTLLSLSVAGSMALLVQALWP